MERTWDNVVLITKGGGKYHGIGLVEVIWKIISVIVNRRMDNSIEFHDVLRGFREKRGTGTAKLEARLPNQILGMRQVVLNEIFFRYPQGL